MSNISKLLFLKGISGVGNARINKFYVPVIKQGIDMDELVTLVKTNESIDEKSIEKELEKASSLASKIENDKEIKCWTVLDKDYPVKLNILGNRKPVLIYYKGNAAVINNPSLAIVGTRSPSSWSMKIEAQLVKKIIELTKRVIVSGLALGCDTIAHKSCVEAGGKTIAVLPSGFNQITPEENKKLSEQIISKGGLLLSEYAPDEKASNYTYVERDVLISAISDATMVVECGKKSGTMHTVEAAFKQGKIVGAYYSVQKNKGDYEGNNYIFEKKNGVRIYDTKSLEDFFNRIAAVGNETVGEQLSLFD